MARGGDPPEPPGAGLRPAGPPVPGLRPAGCLAIPVLADGKRRVYGLWRPPGAPRCRAAPGGAPGARAALGGGSWRTLCLRAGAQPGEGRASCRGRRL